MKNKLIIIFILVFVLQNKLCFCQDLETKLLHLLKKSDVSEVYENLALIKRKFPNQPIPYYVEAFLEKDAKKAINLYQSFIDRFSNSNYAVSACYKIAQYYFVEESYELALNNLDNIITYNAEFKDLEEVYFLKIRCLFALNDFERMKSTYKKFIKLYPKSPYKNIIIVDLKKITGSGEIQSTTSKQSKYESYSDVYTIQIGAYKNREYARKQIELFSNDGYPTEMSSKFIDNELYFLVWIGNYSSNRQAQDSAQKIKQKYGLSYRIVKK